MRKPAGQSACRRKCASSFRFEPALVLVLVVVLVMETVSQAKIEDEYEVEDENDVAVED
jgi:hypothetical protein